MKRLCIVCEGQTEAEFVNSCIAPHLFGFDVLATPSLIKTRPGKHGGGNVSIDRIVQHISNEYFNFDFLTTLVDFYGFRFVQGRTRQQLEHEIMVRLETRIHNFNATRVIPYVQMYEFEALLFSRVEEFQWVLDGWNDEVHEKLASVRSSFSTPEDINDSPATAPSKRIENIFAKKIYKKTEHGPIIAEEIGLDTIRSECPNFHEWVSRLESL